MQKKQAGKQAQKNAENKPENKRKQRMPDAEKFQCIEKIKGILRTTGVSIDETDGIKRVYPSTGWWLVRASNTSPCLICRCEADTPAELDLLKKDLFRLIETVQPIEFI